MPTTLEYIIETERAMQPLFTRMDRDRNLYNMIEYQLKDKVGQPLKDSINVTMNEPKVFADRAQAFMSEASMQVVVEGKHLKDADTTYIENFDSDIRYEIDQRLMLREITSLYTFLVEQVCVRGRLGSRIVCRQDNEIFVPDVLPCDTRYLIYEYGSKDLEYAAFKTVRSRASIEQEYPKAIGIGGTSKRGIIWDHWNKTKNEVWLGGEKAGEGFPLWEAENKLGYPPFVIQKVGAGSMLQDEGAIAHSGESIFANDRLLYEHLNMMASILLTMTMMGFRGTYQWESEGGAEAQPPRDGVGVGKTYSIDKGTKGLFPVEINDIKQATRLFYALLMGAIQRGALPNVDYGNLTFPLSAVAISRLSATKDAIFSPRLQAIALYYRHLHKMLKDQYIKGKYSTELGEEGMRRQYKATDLTKDYTIKYRFHSVSPEQDIANYAVAAQARAVGISQHTTFEKILKLENPKGEIMKSQAEEVRRLDPVIAFFDYGHALIDQGEFFKADLVKDKVKRLLAERFAPITQPTPEGEMMSGNGAKPQQRSLVPLLEGGGGGGRPMQGESELEQMVEPEEVERKERRREEVVRKSEAEG